MIAMASFLGFVDDTGKFALKDRKSFLAYAKKFAGHDVVLSLKKKPNPQGGQQLRYLRGVVIPDIANACGYADPDDYQSVYEGLMWRFYRLADGPFGEPRRKSLSHAATNREEMTEVIDRFITYAETEIPGCRVRRPHEVDLGTIHDPEWK